jgi:hypothetical protein
MNAENWSRISLKISGNQRFIGEFTVAPTQKPLGSLLLLFL